MNRLEIEDEENDGATIIDDGLSTCDEEQLPYEQRMTSAQVSANRSAARQYKYFTLFLLFFAFLISVIVASVRYYSNPHFVKNENGGLGFEFDWGDGKRQKENEERFQQTLEYLRNFEHAEPETLVPEMRLDAFGLTAAYHPQYRAAYWIAKVDELRISIPSTTEPSREEYPFLQRYALAVLYFSTGGLEFWTWKANFLSGRHECDWHATFKIPGITPFEAGVQCDADNQSHLWAGKKTVTRVSLPPLNNMFGTIPPELRHLRHLKTLHITLNEGLHGTIPFQLGALDELKDLTLTNNNLYGTIPRQLGFLKHLERLRLDYNFLSGDTTNGDLDFLEKMKSLTVLTLGYNLKINGTIPDSISELSNLRVLGLSNLHLYGTLPSSLTKLKQLKALYLDDCDFEGSVDVIQSMTNLSHVYLEDNQFNDTIDDTFLAEMKDLVTLDVSNCSFSGSVPVHLLNSSLEILDMSNNNLDGEIPPEAFANVKQTSLKFLSLHTNNITGPIPKSIGMLKNLTTLDLSLNQFTGDIPTELGELLNMEILFLGRNNYNEAPVPEFIRGLTQLTELSLKGSHLTGAIPEWLGELSNLTFLDLGENRLASTIPQSLGNLTDLMVLILNQNKLWGELGLGQLEKLETILIDDNALTGNTDAMCEHKITHFVADCARNELEDSDMPVKEELECSCCTLCCFDENTTCNDSEWLGNHEGIWETGYQRLVWDYADGEISPYENYDRM